MRRGEGDVTAADGRTRGVGAAGGRGRGAAAGGLQLELPNSCGSAPSVSGCHANHRHCFIDERRQANQISTHQPSSLSAVNKGRFSCCRSPSHSDLPSVATVFWPAFCCAQSHSLLRYSCSFLFVISRRHSSHHISSIMASNFFFAYIHISLSFQHNASYFLSLSKIAC